MPEESNIATVLILLPVLYNPDERGNRAEVEEEKFIVTAEEITSLFGGATLHLFKNREVTGFWWDRGVVDRDVHAVLETDIPDTSAAREVLKRCVKDKLIERFRQKAIYMKIIRPVEQLIVTDERVSR